MAPFTKKEKRKGWSGTVCGDGDDDVAADRK
jgi:hypothetical protein